MSEMTNNKVKVLTKKEAEAIQETRKKIIEFKKNITKSYIGLARLLDYVNNSVVANKPLYMHWGYNSFVDYCENELNMSVRKAEMLISISKFIDSKLLADKSYEGKEEVILSEIDQIGWAKAYLLLRVVNNSKDFFAWTSKAKQMGKRELRELIIGKTIKSDEIDNGKPVKFTPFNFKVISSGADIVRSALEHIRSINGENIIGGAIGDGLLLVRMCQHYISNMADASIVDKEAFLTSVMEMYNIESMEVYYENGEKEKYTKSSKANQEVKTDSEE